MHTCKLQERQLLEIICFMLPEIRILVGAVYLCLRVQKTMLTSSFVNLKSELLISLSLLLYMQF